jgi:hypothetical protein
VLPYLPPAPAPPKPKRLRVLVNGVECFPEDEDSEAGLYAYAEALLRRQRAGSP